MNTSKKHFENLSHLLDETKILLEQEISEIPSGLQIQKAPEDSNLRSPEKGAYDRAASVIINLIKTTQYSEDAKRVILDSGYNLIGEAEEFVDESFIQVNNLVVDLTKVYNEVKEVQELASKAPEIDEIRHNLRNVSVAVRKAETAVREIKEKREKYMNNPAYDQFEEELSKYEQELRQKYGIDQIEKGEQELSAKLNKEKKELENSLTGIMQQAKDSIRSIRGIVGEIYEIPEEITKSASIFLKAYGMIAQLFTVEDKPLRMDKEGILKIMEDPELYKKFEAYIHEIEVSDHVKVIGEKLPNLGQIFAEAGLKVAQEVTDAEDELNKAQDELGDEEGTQLNEGAVSDLFAPIFKKSFDAVKGYVRDVKKIFKEFSTKIDSQVNLIQTDISTVSGDFKEYESSARKVALSTLKKVNELENTRYKELEDKL